MTRSKLNSIDFGQGDRMFDRKSRRVQSSIFFSFCLLISVAQGVLGQENAQGSQAQLSEEIRRLNERTDQLTSSQRDLIQRLERREIELAELRARFKTAALMATIGAAFLTLLLAAGTGFSIFGFFKSERRASEAHEFAVKKCNKERRENRPDI